jgi:Base plate wedge protein 53
MYFSSVPNIYYEFLDKDGNSYVKIVKDITTNVRFIKNQLQNIVVYDEYDIIDNETPEMISTKVYGVPQYHWVIMILNDIYDYRTDWPLGYNELIEYTIQKYGEGDNNIYGIHHYVDPVTGYIVNSDYPNAYSVSNFDYENSVNESKRRIKLVSRHVMDDIIKQFTSLYNEHG